MKSLRKQLGKESVSGVLYASVYLSFILFYDCSIEFRYTIHSAIMMFITAGFPG